MIELDDEIRQAVNGAFDSRNPIVIGYVGEDDAPHLSYRGSTQVFGKDQLAVWVRNPAAGLPKAIGHHPKVTLLYRSSEPRRLLTFKGRARVDASANDTVYANSPKGERDRDPEKKGVALIIDLDEVFGFGPTGPVRMARE
jgi:hypothetical protein